MRNLSKGSVLDVRAIAGSYVATLAWDFAEGQDAKKDGLLGFAIERTEFKGAEVVERFFLRGIKRFKDKDKGLAPGTPVPTSEHPVQAFQWGDYTPRPGTRYDYRVVPVYGSPKLLNLDDASATTASITTEAEIEPDQQDGRTRHDIYFNRGVAGSQAYAREFPDQKPDQDAPLSPQMAWLSRGLYEAMIAFIARADSDRHKLRCMFYEFHYKPVGDALKAASEKADIAVRYEAQSYKDVNETMIEEAGIQSICEPQMARPGIRHNKFMVLIEDDRPVAVWTGSTNISAGGIFGHSNVGHIVWDKAIAERFLKYWEELAAEHVVTSELRKDNLATEPTPQPKSEPPQDRILTLFCPRDTKSTNQTLNWYGDVVAAAKRIMCMTFAFNFDEIFQTAFESEGTALRYGVFDKTQKPDVEAQVAKSGMAVIASGALLEKGDLELFIGEVLTGFNQNRYIHDKFILSDPLGDDPVVVTGTANFSRTSQVDNDENMLVIRGNTRVADIYFGEFMRIFDHLYSRYIVAKLKAQGKNDPNAGFLKETSDGWLPPNFSAGPKSLRRQYFMGA